jgi:hypothetical protein
VRLIERVSDAAFLARADYSERGLPAQIVHFAAELPWSTGGETTFAPETVAAMRNDRPFHD